MKKYFIYFLTSMITLNLCIPTATFAAELSESPDAVFSSECIGDENTESEEPDELPVAPDLEEPTEDIEKGQPENIDGVYDIPEFTEDIEQADIDETDEVCEGEEEADDTPSLGAVFSTSYDASSDDEDDDAKDKTPEEITHVSITNVNTETYSYREPKYTAKVSNGNVTVLCEEWRCKDGRINRSAGTYDGHERFRKFEEGNDYYYYITIQAKNNDYFSENTQFNINGYIAEGSLSKDKTVFTSSVVFTSVSSCAHDYKEFVQNATCTVSGRKYKKCKYCSKEVTLDILPISGHEFEEDKKLSIAATCTKAGTMVSVCNKCGDIKSVAVKASGHDFKEDKNKSKAATCVADGYKYETCRHAGCSEVRKESIPKLGHKYKLAPFFGKEDNNGYSSNNTGFGSNSNILRSAMPTCTQAGYRLYYCTNPRCSATYKVTIPATGHNFKKLKIEKAATSSKHGSYCMTCTKCGANDKSWTIFKVKKVILSKTSFTYSGEKNEPKVTVLDEAGKVVDSKNYSVVYLNNVNAGKAVAHITFSGMYKGTKAQEKSFTITKSRQSISTSKSSYTVKKSAVKKKAQTIKLGAKAKTSLTYSSSDKKHVSVSKNGVVTVKKGAPKKTYTITISAKSTKNYKTTAKKIKIKVV